MSAARTCSSCLNGGRPGLREPWPKLLSSRPTVMQAGFQRPARSQESAKSGLRSLYVSRKHQKQQGTQRPSKLATQTTEETRKLALAKSGILTDAKGNLTLPSILLRDACGCISCVDPSTRQRNFSFADIPPSIKAVAEQRRDAECGSDGSWKLTWEDEMQEFSDHSSTFTAKDIKYLAEGHAVRFPRRPQPKQGPSPWSRIPWDRQSLKTGLRSVTYENFMQADSALLEILLGISKYGLAFLTDVPQTPASAAKVVERIGHLRNTFYGSTWDVQSKPNAENVAYTDKDLGFHMDLLYMKEPPKYQFLHCLQNTCIGGESRFVDTAKALQVMSTENPKELVNLHYARITYNYDNNNHHYSQKRVLFDIFDNGNLGTPEFVLKTAQRGFGTIWWSPPFAGRLATGIRPDRLPALVKASKLFADILEREDLVYETKLEPGMCAIFENTRVAHARNAFDINSGQRWLRGAYLDQQPFASKLTNLLAVKGLSPESSA